MDDLTLNLIVIAVTAVLGGGVFLYIRSKNLKEKQNLQQWVISRGWKFETIQEPLSGGFRIKSDRWELESISQASGREAGPGSSDVSVHTIWKANYPGSTVFIGVKPLNSQSNLLSHPLAQKAFQLLTGRNMDGLGEVKIGSSSFQQRYIVLAQDTASAESLLDSVIESALLSWKGPDLLVKQNPEGLTLLLKDIRLKKEDEILGLIRLGELFIQQNR